MNNDLLSNALVYNPNPDAVEEFRILTSNYNAEYGRNGGGIVSVVTKSGTNEFHGSVFEYVRNDDFNANKFFNNEQGIAARRPQAQSVRRRGGWSSFDSESIQRQEPAVLHDGLAEPALAQLQTTARDKCFPRPLS